MVAEIQHSHSRRWYHRWVTGGRGMVLGAVISVPISGAITWVWSHGEAVLVAVVCADHGGATQGPPPATSTQPQAPGTLPKKSGDRP